MILEKSPNETELQHHKRIVYGKLVDKSLSDYDYTTLSKYLYGKSYAPDVARRMFYGSCKTLKLIDEINVSNVSGDDVAKEIEDKIYELKKETQKCRDQRRELNKIISSEGRFEYICDKLAESASKINELNPLIKKETQYPIVASDKEAIVVFSDWHYGLTTDNISNRYNTEVCISRVNHVVNKVSERLEAHKCSKLHVVILGDMIHGAIHTSSRVASEELTCDQLMQVSELIAQSIIKLSNYVPETNVYVTYGNHARVIPNKQDSIHRDNFERIIPWWLKQRLSENKNISVINDDGNEFIMINTCGFGVVATHGDLDSMSSMTNTVSPIFKERFYKSYGIELKSVIIGDKHCFESKSGNGVQSFICGALCGSDDYANSKRLYSDPSQLLLIMDSKVGIDAIYAINC